MRSLFNSGITRRAAVVVGLFIGACWQAVGQRLYEEEVEPQLFRGRLWNSSVGFYTEGTLEQAHYQSGISSTYSRFFEGPLFGLGVDGSIYHPNLFQYSLSGDASVGWTQEKTTTEGTTVSHSTLDYLGNVIGNAIILDNKPYRSSLFVSTGHTFREYDFFNRVIVDSLRYGLRSGYSEGPVPVTIAVTHLDEDTTGSSADSTLHQTTVNLDAHHDRAFGRTTFRYDLDDFNRTTGTARSEGLENTIGIADTETFGPRKNFEWRNEASYTVRDFSEAPGDVVTAYTQLSIEHRTNLWSTYDAHYLLDHADPATSENADAGAWVRHQLYESLTSGLRFRAIHYTTERPGSEFDSMQYAGAWSEVYTKRLSDSARLTLGGALGYSHTDQKSQSDAQVVGEVHTFDSGGAFLNSFFLNLLNVNQATIEVFNVGRTIRYVRGLDYSVTVLGARTLIQLLEPNPSGLTPTTPVVVDYVAAPLGSGPIDGVFADAQIRVDLWNGLCGLYSRYSGANYTAPANIVVEDVNSLTFGVDVFWKWLRAGAEYEIYDSTFATYNAARFFQSLSFAPDQVSTLSFSLAEGWTDYQTPKKTEQYYSAIGRYHRGLTGHLGVDLDAGVTIRTGSIVNELLAGVRPGLSYYIGKLSVKAGYDFEYQDTRENQQRTRNYFFVRAQRAF